jgi:hypothetical protein
MFVPIIRAFAKPAGAGSRVRLRRVAVLGLAASVVAGVLSFAAPVAVESASAATAGSFDPGLIITDAAFFDSSTMTAAQIKTFLRAKAPSCVSYTSGGVRYTCLSTFTQATASRAANSNCSKYTGSSSESAATIIYKVGKACGINPRVILVTLQKEQGLVTGGARTSGIYRKAMGMGCPDTASCNASYYGFFNQVYSAAWQLDQYRAAPSHFNFRAGSTIAVRYSPNASCGSSKVYIRNAATAALYNYTPYQPNSAALSAGTGIGNACSSYGNRNFYNYFTSWFGNSSNLISGGSFDGTSLSGWKDIGGNSNLVLKRNDSRAQSGTGFAATSAAATGRSITRTIVRSVHTGSGYQASIWVRSPIAGSTYNGTLSLSAMGNTTETAIQPFVADDDWQEVDVRLDVDRPHSSLRFSVIEQTPAATLFLDSASVSAVVPQATRAAATVPSYSFESSLSGWAAGTGHAFRFVRKAAITSFKAEHGKYYLLAKTMHPSSALRTEVARKSAVGDSYTTKIWVRAATAGKPVSGRLVLVGVGGANELSTTKFVAGPEWTLVQTTLTMKKTAHTSLRVVVNIDSGNRGLAIDNASIAPTLLANPSFETSATEDWFESAGGAYTAKQVTNPLLAHDGSDYVQLTRTGTATTRFASDVERSVTVGQTYTVSGWFRSGDPSAHYVSELRLIARGGTADPEAAVTAIDVGPEWTYFSATLKTTTPQTDLRVDIRAGSMAFPLEIDGLTLR